VAAPRLLILADPKMLPALSNGLREGGRFDVLPVPLSDGGAAAAAAPRADAVAVFYGAPGRPLAATVQMLAPAVRGKGGRIIAVLQKEAVAQRDECFRAGASDLLFMPMSKDKFVSRLEAAVALAYSPENGAPADVQVSSRTAQVKLTRAVVTASGVHASTAVPFLAGETVRLSFEADGAPIQAWGLVAANAPEVRIRFAGLAPEEEVRFRDWVKKQPAGSRAAAPVPPAKLPGAPLSGPPPGFADRPRARGETAGTPGPAPRSKRSAAPPIVSRTVPDAAELDTPPMVAPLPSPDLETPPDLSPVSAVPDGEPKTAPEARGVGATLFEGMQTPASVRPVQPAVEPVVWPVPLALDAAKSAVLAALFSPDQKPDVSQEVLLSAKKVATALSGGEKAAIERLGAESHFADAAAERVCLDVARAEGTRLAAASEPSKVDDAAVKAMTQRVDAVVGSLQKDADGAIARGEVDALQVVRASSAALSRDLLSLKAVADRLRGLAAAPRLGAGALDPDMVLPGQAPSARPPPAKAPPEAPVRAELKEFEKFAETKPGARRKTTLYVLFAALAAGAAYVVFFALPNVKEIDGRAANIPGVVRVEIGGTGARVVVSAAFVEKPEPGLTQLIALLREKEVSSAAIFNVNGVPVGQIDVKTGATSGLTAVKKQSPPPR